MTEFSLPWPDTTEPGPQVGDGRPYAAAEWSQAWEATFSQMNSASEGVLHDVWNELAVTAPAANTIRVNTGAALLKGHIYWNDAPEDLSVNSAPAGSTRKDRVILRCDWTGEAGMQYKGRLVIKEGNATNPPSLSQTDNAIWEISLARYTVDDAGNISDLTDEREFCHFATKVDEDMLDTSVAGNGLSGGDGSALAVNVDDATIEIASDTLRVKDGGISTAKLADDAVTQAKIASRAVDNTEIALGGVLEGNIANGAVTTKKLAAGAVTGTKIADSAITAVKIANRTRRFLVPLGASSEVSHANHYMGWDFVDGAAKCTGYSFMLPEDFVGSLKLRVLLQVNNGAGLPKDVKIQNKAYCQPVDPANTGYNGVDNTEIVQILNAGAITPTPWRTLSGTYVVAGNVVMGEVRRYGGDSEDTYNDAVFVIGVEVEYEADS